MHRLTITFRRTVTALVSSLSLFLPTLATGANLQVSCTAKAAAEVNEGLTLLHNMMYIHAEEVFNHAASSDPDCAMAQWGIAMSNFHPLWPGGPTAAETDRGRAAAEALAPISAKTSLEQALISAATAFYAPDLDRYPDRLAAWAKAQIAAGQDHPGNVDAAALAALARLAIAPRGAARMEELADVGDTLDALHQKAPDHPGVIHYAIHAFDNPALKTRGKPYAEIYDKSAPDAPHALHMPAHIFTRTGDWQASIDLNRRAAKAALDLSGDILQTHYAHAIDYLVYGHLQRGEHQDAANLVSEMMAYENHQVSFGGANALAAAPVRILLEADKWSEAAELSPDMHPSIPWNNFPQAVAMRWFAKGLGAARSGDIKTASSAVLKLVQLRDKLQAGDQGYWAQLTDAQILTVEAWIELDRGNEDLAVVHHTSAADLEDEIGKSPVTPGHILPARELLGDLLASLGRKQEAARAYRATLEVAPNRRRSLQALR